SRLAAGDPTGGTVPDPVPAGDHHQGQRDPAVTGPDLAARARSCARRPKPVPGGALVRPTAPRGRGVLRSTVEPVSSSRSSGLSSTAPAVRPKHPLARPGPAGERTRAVRVLGRSCPHRAASGDTDPSRRTRGGPPCLPRGRLRGRVPGHIIWAVGRHL